MQESGLGKLDVESVVRGGGWKEWVEYERCVEGGKKWNMEGSGEWRERCEECGGERAR